jgi:hypothetical protein
VKALQIYAGRRALARIREQGLTPADVRVISGAAGGPKGLTLLPLDRFIFGEWLPQSTQPIDLVGASIGAWRMAAACLPEPVAALEKLQHDYIHQQYDVPPGKKRPSPEHISERFGMGIDATFSEHVEAILQHPRYRLHVVTSRGRHLLHRDTAARAPLGYFGAYMTNVVSRRAMGAWIERAVFSAQAAPLPFAANDYRTRRYALSPANFSQAVQASCSIPFVLKAVHDIPGAPRGAYWDGGITDYHLHLDYRAACGGAEGAGDGVVLYPHFQRAVVPGWLDKSLKWRHGSTAFLDDVIVLAPSPEWIKTLPNGKIPDRSDFTKYGSDFSSRVAAWTTAVAESERLRDEFAQWVESGASANSVLAL